jgi:hypothetical protein
MSEERNERSPRTHRKKVGDYQMPRPIRVMLSAIQLNRPTAMIVSNVTDESVFCGTEAAFEFIDALR